MPSDGRQQLSVIWLTMAWGSWLLMAHSASYFLLGSLVKLPFFWSYPISLALTLTCVVLYFLHKKTISASPQANTSQWQDQRSTSHAQRGTPRLSKFTKLILLIAITIYRWKLFNDSSGNFQVVPNHDAIHHATQISNIIRWNSVSPEAMYAGPSGPIIEKYQHPGGLYPLGAFISHYFGFTPSEAIYLLAQLSTLLLIPLALYGFGIAFMESRRAIGPTFLIAYLASSGLYILPFSPLSNPTTYLRQ